VIVSDVAKNPTSAFILPKRISAQRKGMEHRGWSKTDLWNGKINKMMILVYRSPIDFFYAMRYAVCVH